MTRDQAKCVEREADKAENQRWRNYPTTSPPLTAAEAQRRRELVDKMDAMWRACRCKKAIIFRGRRIEYDEHLDCYFGTDQQWRNSPWPRRYPVPRPAFVDDSKQVFYGPQRKGLKQ